MKRKKENKNKKTILNALLIIFICSFLYSGYHVFMWVKSDKELKKIEESLYKEVVTKAEESEKEGKEIEPKVTIDFSKLKQINEDVFAWITIDNTYINYPILQGETDEYYLRKNIYKTYNHSGSIFVYHDVNKEFLDENTVIYGHNMKNERMFADLDKIYKGELGTDVDIKIYTENNVNTYKVFACYIDKPNVDIIKKDFSKEEKEEYINKAIEKSNIKFYQDVTYENKMITLITCGNTNQERIIVNAIKE